MNQLIEVSNAWSIFLIDRAATFLWQSTILVVAIALVARMLRRASPAIRFWLWQIAAVKLLLLPYWSVDASLPAKFLPKQPTQPVVSIEESTQIQQPIINPPATKSPPLAFSPPRTTSIPPVSWQTWLLAVWLAAVAYQVARVFAQRRALHRLLRQAQPSTELATLVQECATTLKLRRLPTAVLIDADISPFVCGLREPRLVLAKSFANAATPERLRQIVLHELAHMQRQDLLWCWISSVMQIVYWFHPAAHWVAYHVQLERELACDQVAIEHSGGTAHEYADTLIDVVSHTASWIASQAAFSAHFVGEAK